MFYDADYDEEALRSDALLFWGAVGPQTGAAVVVAPRPADLLAWFRERAKVEGRSSYLARALVDVERVAKGAGGDAEVIADAIGSTLEESGILVWACGPIERELRGNEDVRARIFGDAAREEPVPEGVWRGGEAHVEVEGSAVSPPEGDDDAPERGYRIDDELEDLAEHAMLDLERPDHRAFLAGRLEALRVAPEPKRRAA